MARDLRLATERAARRHGLDPRIFLAQIQQESNFNPNAGSSAGARGIAQIMPGTAKAWGVDLNDGLVSDDLNAAAKNMAGYIKQFGSVEKALRAYNAGPGAVERSRGYGETNEYVKRILGGAKGQALRGGSMPSSPQRSQQPGTPGSARVVGSPGTSTFTPDTTSTGEGLAGLLSASMQRQQAQSSGPQLEAPSFSSSRFVNAMLPGGGGASVKPRLDIGAALNALEAAPAVADVQRTAGTTRIQVTPGSAAPARAPSPAAGGGKPSGKVKILEMFHDPGVSLDNGKRTAAIGGHGSHVHISFASPQGRAKVLRIAKDMGMVITSEGGGKHTAGSFHYRKFANGSSQGVDFGAPGNDPKKLLAFNRRVARMAR